MKTNATRAAAHRDRKRQDALRELRIWVPDTRMVSRRASLEEQGRAIAANQADEAEVMDLIESWQGLDEAK
ncbi:MAG: antitoxin MazE family protein [Bifidobacteriaceae bacterium]|nr:antitoxin MazE family protein [Bifidobacteriaceae bacterium]